MSNLRERLGGQVLLIAGLGLAALTVSAMGGGHGHPHPSAVLGALRCAGSALLVACASALTWLAVRVVSAQEVIRRDWQDEDEPALPRHRPEPEEALPQDARRVPRQARAVPLPGREQSPRTEPASSGRPEDPEPETAAWVPWVSR